MKTTKMYLKSKENVIGFYLFIILFFICSFLIKSIIFEIFCYIMFPISIIYLIYILYKTLTLKYEEKNNITAVIEIVIDKVDDISSICGWRQQFKKNYFGVKIISIKSRYLYFYKKILNTNSDFSLYNRIKNLKKIKIEVYKKSKIIKKIITKL